MKTTRERKIHVSNNRSTSYPDHMQLKQIRFHTTPYHSNENHAITPTQSSHTIILKKGKVGVVEIFTDNDS